MNPPVKYYGSKFLMKDQIMSRFPLNYNKYIEGFGGGASILLAKTRDVIEVYNDLGQNIYSLYSVIQDEERFKKLKHRMDLSLYSAQQRDISKELLKGKLSVDDRAYHYLIVNRLSFNGVGGFSVNLSVRRSMSKSTSDYLSMIDRLPELHDRLSSVIIENRNIIDLIKRYDSEDSFFYLDPPYVHSTRSSSTNYEQEMTDDEHREMLELIQNSKGKFLISGYANDIYKMIEIDGWHRYDFKSPNTGSNKIETLWWNYDEYGEEKVSDQTFF